jgi:hypothetical protein
MLSMRTIALAIMLFCTSGMIYGQSRSTATISPSRRVPFFAVKQRNLIDALLSFGGLEHIPIGIEYIDKAAFQQRISVEFRERNVKEILDAITHPVGYRWFINGPVVLVTHNGALVGKSNLLNTHIPRFQIGETSMHEASLALSLHLYFVLNPNSGGIAGDSPGGTPAFRVGPFDFKNGNVRDILNQIVRSTAMALGSCSNRRGRLGKTSGMGYGRCWSMTGRMPNTAGNYKCGAWVCKLVRVGWRNIAIARFDPDKGEEKAQSCENA